MVRRCLANLRPFADRRRPLVADCSAGAGTTGLVARALGMDDLLVERDPGYVAGMRAALEAEGEAVASRRDRLVTPPAAQGRLF